MKRKNFDNAIESGHNMLIMIMLFIGLDVGLKAYEIVVWIFPLIANIMRRIGKMRFLE